MLIARLEHLEGLRLAERVSRTSWRLVEGWQKRLRDHGSRGDILQQIHAAVRGDPSRYDAVRPGEALPPEPGMAAPVVTGRVAGKGLSDELKGTFYAVVETPAGRAYHVPLDARSAQTVGVGDLVSLATPPESPVRPADRQIAEAARARGGVFAVDPSAGGDAQALARRLRDLERAGLVAAEGPARWKVPPDLVDRLAERARDAPPRHRLVVRKEPLSLKEQVVHRGPVWLDRVETKTLAYWGLGADVRQAVAERREALRRLGIGPDDPDRVAKLRELERQRARSRDCRTLGPDVPRARTGRLPRAHPAGRRRRPTGRLRRRVGRAALRRPASDPRAARLAGSVRCGRARRQGTARRPSRSRQRHRPLREVLTVRACASATISPTNDRSCAGPAGWSKSRCESGSAWLPVASLGAAGGKGNGPPGTALLPIAGHSGGSCLLVHAPREEEEPARE